MKVFFYFILYKLKVRDQWTNMSSKFTTKSNRNLDVFRVSKCIVSQQHDSITIYAFIIQNVFLECYSSIE